ECAAKSCRPRALVRKGALELRDEGSELHSFAAREELGDLEFHTGREHTLSEPHRLGEIFCRGDDRCNSDHASAISRRIVEAASRGVQQKPVADLEFRRVAATVARK